MSRSRARSNTRLVRDLVKSAAAVADNEDGIDAELLGAVFVAMATVNGDELVPLFVQDLIPQIEATASREALVLLLAIRATATGVQEELARAAADAADRLVAADIPRPRWAPELAEPVRATDCRRLHDRNETASVLVASFRRASHEHAVIIVVDEMDCGAAAAILFAEAGQLEEALDDINAGPDLETQVLDEAGFRWYAEEALAARAVHDADAPMHMADDEDDEPPYPVLAVLVRARLAAMAEARPPDGARRRPHVDSGEFAAITVDALATLMNGVGFGPPEPAKLPPKRKKTAGPAPIYQLKVGLHGVKPPVWRRLLVPADVSLARLHHVIQAAFAWEDSHLHVFETPYGAFGQPDPELGYRSEASATLEQVAAGVGDKFEYTYDFGASWVHDIAVEKVLARDPAQRYPQCTGGRQGAPFEDIGFVEDHPTTFDKDEVNRALAKLR